MALDQLRTAVIHNRDFRPRVFPSRRNTPPSRSRSIFPHVCGNRVQPIPKRTRTIVASDLSIGQHEGFLRQVLRFLPIAHHPIQVRVYASRVILDQRTKCIGLPLLHLGYACSLPKGDTGVNFLGVTRIRSIGIHESSYTPVQGMDTTRLSKEISGSSPLRYACMQFHFNPYTFQS